MEKLIIRKPDDLHLHLRQGESLAAYVQESAAAFKRALIMPNTIPPVSTVEILESYRNEIETFSEGFTPLMTFKILPGMSGEDVVKLKSAGALVGKYYPAGATTNAEDGVSSPDQIREVLAVMAQEGIVLSVHGEDPEAPVLAREISFFPQLEKILKDHPSLKVVFEHISCRESLDFLNAMPDRLAGTVTVHHLLFTLEDLMGGSFNPHLFCKPVLKTEQDRLALVEAVMTGHPRLFFGSDSAPHPRERKEAGVSSAGVFTSPVAMPLLAELFEKEGALEKLEPFVSQIGADYYGLPLNEEKLTLVKEQWIVPELIGGAVPFLAGKELSWRVLP